MKVGTRVKVSALWGYSHDAGILGQIGVVVWRRGRKWVRVRLDDHADPLSPSGNGWFLPTVAVTRP